MEISGVELSELEFENIGNWPALVRIFVMIGVFVATLIVGYMLDLSDQWGTLSSAHDKRQELEKTFEVAQHKVANLDAYKAQVKLVEVELEKLTEQLPQSNEEAGLLEDISQQASSASLQFVSIKPGQEQSKEFYIENPMQLTLSGVYQGFGAFVSSISSMQRIVTFHDFTITRSKPSAENTKGGGDETMKGPLTMTVMTKTYWTVSNKGGRK